ncbi:hypothetical protein ACH518_04185 [Methylomonas sp. HW2-6]|uniref:hypothetical protein n=1 Tax=Methylomonas sp. HW2-6 TaxID=3376687 RepID=UPI00404364CD
MANNYLISLIESGLFITLVKDFIYIPESQAPIPCRLELVFPKHLKLVLKAVGALSNNQSLPSVAIYRSNLIFYLTLKYNGQSDLFDNDFAKCAMNSLSAGINQAIDKGLNYLDSLELIGDDCFRLRCGEAKWAQAESLALKLTDVLVKVLAVEDAIKLFGQDRYNRLHFDLNKLVQGQLHKTGKTIYQEGELIGVWRSEHKEYAGIKSANGNIRFDFEEAQFGERLAKLHGDGVKAGFEFDIFQDLVGIKQNTVYKLKTIKPLTGC